MNRKKKMNNILKKKLKKANSKLHTDNKPKYVSKADRAKMSEDESTEVNTNTVEQA